MTIPDLINGCFETCGGVAILLHIVKLYNDKKVQGVSWLATLFFVLWGYWNLYYYPHLNQWLSFVGGIFLVAMNTIWLSMMIYYSLKTKMTPAIRSSENASLLI